MITIPRTHRGLLLALVATALGVYVACNLFELRLVFIRGDATQHVLYHGVRASILCGRTCRADGAAGSSTVRTLTLADGAWAGAPSSVATCDCAAVAPLDGDSNGSAAAAASAWPLHPGFRLPGDACYEFLSTVPKTRNATRPVMFHVYWRTITADIGPIQLAALRAIFATQDPAHTSVTLWTAGRPLNPAPVHDLLQRFGPTHRFMIRGVNLTELAAGTPVERLERDGTLASLTERDKMAYLDGDLVRLLALWHTGGVWVDLDVVLLRSLAPLLHEEWLHEWDCDLPRHYPLNMAVGHFRKHSKFLHQFLEGVVRLFDSGHVPAPHSLDLGAFLYWGVMQDHIVRQRLFPVAGVLPWCFVDSTICRGVWRVGHQTPYQGDADAPVLAPADIYIGGEHRTSPDQRAALQGFALHLHHAWNSPIAPDSPLGLAIKAHDDILAAGPPPAA